jgi:glycosyltransferase involved in cell wall biosynthesis
VLEHVPDMLAYRRQAADADVVHFQWLALQAVDRHLLPRRPTVLTAHDLLPREPRPGQVRAQRRLYEAVNAVVVHSELGRRELVGRVGVDAAKVHVIHHGAFDYLTQVPRALPEELAAPGAAGSPGATASPTAAADPASPTRPVVLFFGLLRPYKGLDVLLEAWRSLDADAELWIVGRPRMDIAPLGKRAPASVRFVPRFVTDPELAACFASADLVVLPYLATERFDFSGVLATALAFGKPAVISDIGGFAEVAQAGAARLVPPGDADALADALRVLLSDPQARERLADGARAAAAGPYSLGKVAQDTIALYHELAW